MVVEKIPNEEPLKCVGCSIIQKKKKKVLLSQVWKNHLVLYDKRGRILVSESCLDPTQRECLGDLPRTSEQPTTTPTLYQ
jgi:hypothetical protein